MKFSQRIGKTPIKSVLQVETIDDDLKNRLWNIIIEDYFETVSDYASYGGETPRAEICNYLWKEFFKSPIDTIPKYSSGSTYIPGFLKFLRNWFFNEAEWFDVYDLVEFFVILDNSSTRIGLADKFNIALRREVAGYRLIQNRVTQITSEDEVQEIETAIHLTDKWKSVNTHLRTALDLLSDKKNPDYRNSIKESISAVESLCKIITGDKNATLGKALSQIEVQHALHGALKTAFSALYGFTSDAGGIRHALLEGGQTVLFEEAKFMLVSCSSFINYLKSKLKL